MSTAAERHLTVVPDATPAAPIEGVVIPAQKAPEWAWSDSWIRRAVAPAAVGRGAARIFRSLHSRYHDDWPHMIATAEAHRAASDDLDEQTRLNEIVHDRRRAYRIHRLKTAGTAGAWTAAGTLSAGAGILTGSLWVDLLVAGGLWGWGAWRGRGDDPQPIILPATPGTGPNIARAVVDGDPVDTDRIEEPELLAALAALGVTRPTVRASTPLTAEGTRTVTVGLGGATTVTELRKKTEQLAAALGRDVTMVDISKAGHAGEASIWLADTDPFETPRPSPLLTHDGPIDSWVGGLPVAYDKRILTVSLTIVNQNMITAGGTRSGKGVAASNVAVGCALDPWVNLRIVAGKHNGEWDSYARTGIASTYFKPSPERLLALLRALLADKDRRERELGRHQKSKMIHGLIQPLGGMELLIIDEVATYTRPGKPLRDEIVEALIELAAVAAGAGILMLLITQYPDVDVIPQALSTNCKIRWAMPVENATQSNAILGAGQSGAGRDASKFDPPRPGLGWLKNPFAGTTDLARSFDLDEDERGEVTLLLQRAAGYRKAAGRLAGQWDDPIEQHLLHATGLSSAAGGPQHDGVPGRSVVHLTDAQRHQLATCRAALDAMDQLGRDVAQLDEMADIIGAITGEQLGETLRAAGAGGTVKVVIGDRRVNGYRRADIADALNFLQGA